MIYFDTDVWINSLVNQHTEKHEESREIINNTRQAGWIISNLNIQEILFVLAKLEIPSVEINKIAGKFLQFDVMHYSYKELQRAIIIAEKIGYQHINDCIHTAIAESHCKEIITYNKKDFKKIEELTSIKVKILGE